MALQFYADLKASVADWLQRGDLTVVIPDFIAMAEAEISRRLVLEGVPREMMSYAQAPINDEFETTPSDFMGVRSIFIEGSKCPLDYVDPEKIAERKARYATQTGNPVVYTVLGSSFQFWPVPPTELLIDLFYIKRVPSLNDSIVANWLLTLHPDCYLYGSLLQAAPYLKDDDRVALWQGRFDQIITAICAAGRRSQTAPHLAMPIRQDIA